MHQSFLLSRPRKKKMCVYYCMEKLKGSAAKNGDGRMIVNKHTFFFGPIHFGLLHLFHLALLGQEKI